MVRSRKKQHGGAVFTIAAGLALLFRLAVFAVRAAKSASIVARTGIRVSKGIKAIKNAKAVLNTIKTVKGAKSANKVYKVVKRAQKMMDKMDIPTPNDFPDPKKKDFPAPKKKKKKKIKQKKKRKANIVHVRGVREKKWRNELLQKQLNNVTRRKLILGRQFGT